MRLEELQTRDSEGRLHIRPMVEVLPNRISVEENSVYLRAGWFSGCMPLGYLFLGIALVHIWLISEQVGDSGLSGAVFGALALVLGELGLAFWMFSKRIQWQIDRHEIVRQRMVPVFSNPTRWAAQNVIGVVIVEQGTFTIRYQMFAPGIWLVTDAKPIDLGGFQNLETVREIAKTIAELLEIPLEDHSREGIFDSFKTGRRKLGWIAILIALALIALLRWLGWVP